MVILSGGFRNYPSHSKSSSKQMINTVVSSQSVTLYDVLDEEAKNTAKPKVKGSMKNHIMKRAIHQQWN